MSNLTRNLLFSPDTEEQKVKQTAEAESQQSFTETLKDTYKNAALNSVVTASVIKGIDKLSGDKRVLSREELSQLYPNAPKEMFKSPMTRLQAALNYAQYEAEDTMQRSQESRDAGTFSKVGYGLLGGFGDPIAGLSVGVGGSLFRGAGAVAGRFAPSVSSRIAAMYGAESVSFGQVVAREFGENALNTLAMDMPASVYSKGDSKAELTPKDIATQLAIGTALGTGVSYLSDAFKYRTNGGKKISEQSIPSTIKNNIDLELLRTEFQALMESDPSFAQGSKSNFDALKLMAYDRAKTINTVSDLALEKGKYFGITEKITGLDTSFEPKYGETGVFVNDPRIAEGIAQISGADFSLNSVDISGAKALVLDTAYSDLNPKTFKLVTDLLGEDASGFNLDNYSSKSGNSLKDLFDDIKDKLPHRKEMQFFANLQDELFKDGYTAFSYTGGNKLQGNTSFADTAHEVIQVFDHLTDEDILSNAKTYIKDLNYQNRKMLLEYAPTKKTKILNEGYMSNGKTIKLNEGYFESIAQDDTFMTKGDLEAYSKMFSKEQIDDIQTKVNEGNFKSIAQKYKDLVGKKDLLLQIEDYKQFDSMFAKYEEKVQKSRVKALTEEKGLISDINDSLEEVFMRSWKKDIKEEAKAAKDFSKIIYNDLKKQGIKIKEKQKLVIEQIKKDLERTVIQDKKNVEAIYKKLVSFEGKYKEFDKKIVEKLFEDLKIKEQVSSDFPSVILEDLKKAAKDSAEKEAKIVNSIKKDLIDIQQNEKALKEKLFEDLQNKYEETAKEALKKDPAKMEEIIKASTYCLNKG